MLAKIKLQNSAIYCILSVLMERRKFRIKEITVNGRKISDVQVDEHAFDHKDISDSLIVELVLELDGVEQQPEDTKPPYEYFVNLVEVKGKQYRLVWCLEDKQLYVGVITAYRDKRRKRNGPSK